MNTLEKVKKGVSYLIDQQETKLKGLGSLEKGKFVPTDPKAYKTHKSQVEFRLKFCQAVEDLLNDHIALSNLTLALIDGELNSEEKKQMKEQALKYKS